MPRDVSEDLAKEALERLVVVVPEAVEAGIPGRDSPMRPCSGRVPARATTSPRERDLPIRQPRVPLEQEAVDWGRRRPRRTPVGRQAWR